MNKKEINCERILHESLYNKHNFKPELYDLRVVNQLISQQKNHLYLQFTELAYYLPKEYISKDLKKKLSFAILKEICPLCDCIPYVPFLSDFPETKRLTRVLDEKLNIFLQQNNNDDNDNEKNKAKDNNDSIHFLTDSVIEEIDNNFFIEQPDRKTKGSNNHIVDNAILNESYEGLKKIIVSIQYSEDIKAINQKQQTHFDYIKQESIKPLGGKLELNFRRQESRKDTLQKAHMEIGEKVRNEEIKFGEKIIIEQEEMKKKKMKKKFKQTKTFLMKYNQNKEMLKNKGELFEKIIESFWEKNKEINASHHHNKHRHHFQNSNDSLRKEYSMPIQTQGSINMKSSISKKIQMTSKSKEKPFKAYLPNAMSSNRGIIGYQTNLKHTKVLSASYRNNNSTRPQYPDILINHSTNKQSSKYSFQTFEETFNHQQNNQSNILNSNHSKNHSSSNKHKAFNSKIKTISLKKKDHNKIFSSATGEGKTLIQLKIAKEPYIVLKQRFDLKKLLEI